MPGSEKMDDMALAHILEFLEKKDFKKKFLKKLNDNIDIPIINEKTEKKVMDKIYDTVVKAIKNINK